MRRFISVVTVAILALIAGSSYAQTYLGLKEITSGTGTQIVDPTRDVTVGWRFDVLQPIVVTHLGMWDNNGDGLLQSHNVAIWGISGGDPLLSATVPSGASSGTWKWVSVQSQIVLDPGSYVIGALMPYTPGTSMDPYLRNAAGVQMGPSISFVENRYASVSGYRFPETNDPNRGYAYFGPNFQYNLAVPEPALIQLPLLIGCGGIGLWWKRRRSAA